MSSIISRETWGARHNDGFHNRKVGRLDKWLHHSVTTQLDTDASQDREEIEIRKLEDIGQSRFKGGISYTFVFAPSGRIYEGHSIGRVGAHTAGRNSISAGLCLLGNYETHEVTVEQVAAVAWLLNHGVTKGWWTENKLDGGHRDTKATACPGSNGYSAISTINAAAKAKPGTIPAASKPSTPKPPAPKPAGKSVQQMASEVRAGKHGNGHDARRKSLGVSAAVYEQVRSEVNKRATGKAPAPAGKSISQMATEVIAGKHGNGHANRQKSLGVSAAVYAKVRAEVNRRA